MWGTYLHLVYWQLQCNYVYGLVRQELEIPGRFLEHALVHGNLYGTSQEAVQRVRDKGQICILDVDVQGPALHIYGIYRKWLAEMSFIWVWGM